eukprot:PLAT4000.3.p1 GENE.PLAT4000.3~~PLAT4000.3.p1  ORF type:complete len:655 (-),score=371.52 PLAT4000.3:74-2038(-)
MDSARAAAVSGLTAVLKQHVRDCKLNYVWRIIDGDDLSHSADERTHTLEVVWSAPAASSPVASDVVHTSFHLTGKADGGWALQWSVEEERLRQSGAALRRLNDARLAAILAQKRVLQGMIDVRLDYHDSRMREPSSLDDMFGRKAVEEGEHDGEGDGAGGSGELAGFSRSDAGSGDEGDDDLISEAVADWEDVLVRLFEEADLNKSGSLDLREFRLLLHSSELGLGESEMALLMAQADSNDDGEIDYAEFVPVAVDILATLRAGEEARAELAEEEDAASEEAMRLLFESERGFVLKAIANGCAELDADRTGLLTRKQLRRVLEGSSIGLTRGEVNVVLGHLDSDEFGLVEYADVPSLLFEMWHSMLRDSILQRKSGDLQRYLLDLCIAADYDRSGLLTVDEMSDVLGSSRHLLLGKLQRLTLVAGLDRNEDGKIDYRASVPMLTRSVRHMYHPKAVALKARLIHRAEVQPVALLTNRDELEAELLALFRDFDRDRNGVLDREEFRTCIQTTGLVDERNIDSLMLLTDRDGDGEIDYEEFLEMGYDILLYLERERTIRELGSDALAKLDEEDALEEAAALEEGAHAAVVARHPDEYPEEAKLRELSRAEDDDEDVDWPDEDGADDDYDDDDDGKRSEGSRGSRRLDSSWRSDRSR